MHDIMRFPSEKNKQKGNRDMEEDAELAVKHNTQAIVRGKTLETGAPHAAVPAVHRKSWASCSGHNASAMQTCARSSSEQATNDVIV